MKKGFTLVELLAVIVILAIILVIAVPQINNVIKQTKMNSLGSTAKLIAAKAEEKEVENEALENNESLTCSDLVKFDSNYGSCTVSKIDNKWTVRISGASNGKFAGYICTGTKNDINCKEKEVGAIFLTGEEVNIKMKQLANPTANDITRAYEDTNVTAILKSNVEPDDSNKQSNNIVSTSDSKYLIYMWYQNGTIYWWSEDSYPYLNSNSSHMFRQFINLTNISGLSNFDTSNMTDMTSMFASSASLTSLEGLENWDVSNVETMLTMFAGKSTVPMKIESLKPLRNWNTGKVKDMTAMFQVNTSLTSLEGLENWNVSNVEDMSNMFYGKTTSPMKIKSLKPLKNWDTHKVKSMSIMFQANTELTSLEGLENWDVSNVETMKNMFYGDTGIVNLKPLKNWNVSNVDDLFAMFQKNTSLIDASDINDWDIKTTANFESMFEDTPVHPNFTKVNGTWSSDGTFVVSGG